MQMWLVLILKVLCSFYVSLSEDTAWQKAQLDTETIFYYYVSWNLLRLKCEYWLRKT